MTVADPVQQIVLNCLNHFAYQDAIFLSERFHAEFQSEESLYLLALSYYKTGSKTLRAYHILKERQLKLPKSRYLLGKCCIDLNKYGEAESVLTNNIFSSASSSSHSSGPNSTSTTLNNPTVNSNLHIGSSHSTTTSATSNSSGNNPLTSSSSSKHKLYEEVIKEYGPEYSSYVLQILATVYSKTDRLSQAVEFYKKSLRQNPFMWSSFEAICNIGEKIDPTKYFTYNSALNAYKSQILDTNSVLLNQHQQQLQQQQQQQQQQQHIFLQQQQNQQMLQQQQLNVMKQQHHDMDNDMMDHKCKQDIVQILRLVEADQITKLANPSKQKVVTVCPAQIASHHHHHHHHHVKSSKENQNDDQVQSQMQVPCCHCCCGSGLNNEALGGDISGAYNKPNTPGNKQTPLLNQVLTKTTNFQFSNQYELNINNVSASNPSTSSTSLSTPPQIISANNLAPPQKKCLSKRQTTSTTTTTTSTSTITHVSNKPLFGQNTTNNLSNTTSGTTSAANNQNTIRRSSRIFAAQNANANAVKENKKQSTSATSLQSTTSNPLQSSSSSTSATSSQSTTGSQSLNYTENQTAQSSSSSGSVHSSASSTSSLSSSSSTSSKQLTKRPKLKKKSTTSTSASELVNTKFSTGSNTVNTIKEIEIGDIHQGEPSQHQNQQQEDNSMDCNSCQTFNYPECRHCSLLLTQSKNLYTPSGGGVYSNVNSKNVNNSQNINPLSNSAAGNTGNACMRRSSFKFSLLIEQSVYLDNLMKLLKDLGQAVYYMKQYECEQAIAQFEQLPQHQLNSSFVLSQIARSHFELHNYLKAEKVYAQLRREYPYHLEGLEFYSTTLWHLQKEIGLSALAQELTEFDKLAPETWCVVGNCFSLHKEHDAAIKFFQRATQVDPKFAYAYNLLGHEYFLIEEMDKGLSCFRKAIFLDTRHYNAWYGISMIHLKQEKFLLAEKYLKKALLINPHSSTLMCHIAVVYHSLKQSDKALQILNRALAIEPRNTLCKFHRASILFSMEKYDEALEEFERLRRIIPKESLIYYMISKTHKKLKNVHLSLMYMSWAMDLDPKGVNNQLKESIDKRYVVDSDSTFARELDTINTSTLDAIYGNNGNDLLQQSQTENNNTTGGNDDLEMSANANNTTANQQQQLNQSDANNNNITDTIRIAEDEDEEPDAEEYEPVNNNNNNNNNASAQQQEDEDAMMAAAIAASTASANNNSMEEDSMNPSSSGNSAATSLPSSSSKTTPFFAYLESKVKQPMSSSSHSQQQDELAEVAEEEESMPSVSVVTSANARQTAMDEDLIDDEAEFRVRATVKDLLGDDEDEQEQEEEDEQDDDTGDDEFDEDNNNSEIKRRLVKEEGEDDDEDEDITTDEDENDHNDDENEDDDNYNGNDPGNDPGMSGSQSGGGGGGGGGGNSNSDMNKSNSQHSNRSIGSSRTQRGQQPPSDSGSGAADDLRSTQGTIKKSDTSPSSFSTASEPSTSSGSSGGEESKLSPSSRKIKAKLLTRYHQHQRDWKEIGKKCEQAYKKIVFPPYQSIPKATTTTITTATSIRERIINNTRKKLQDQLVDLMREKKNDEEEDEELSETESKTHSSKIITDLSTINMHYRTGTGSKTMNDSSTATAQGINDYPSINRSVSYDSSNFFSILGRSNNSNNNNDSITFDTTSAAVIAAAASSTANNIHRVQGNINQQKLWRNRRNLLLTDYGFQQQLQQADEDEDEDDSYEDKHEFFTSMNQTGGDNRSISFLSMNGAIDVTGNATKNNETISFLSQSQISALGGSGQKFSINQVRDKNLHLKPALFPVNNNNSTNHVENSSMQDQLMDSIEEDL